MLDVVADIARQDEDRLDQGGDGGAGNPIFLIIALDGAVLANDARILNGDMPGAIGHDPIEQESVPGAEHGQSPRSPTSSWDRPNRAPTRCGGSHRSAGLCIGDASSEICGSPRPRRTPATSGR